MENPRNKQFISVKSFMVLSAMKCHDSLLWPTRDLNHFFAQYLSTLTWHQVVSYLAGSMDRHQVGARGPQCLHDFRKFSF